MYGLKDKEKISMEPFSVLMSVYKNEDPSFFSKAMDSVLCQTVMPEEIILVKDGEITDKLQAVVDSYIKDKTLFTYIPLVKNSGLGNALRVGVDQARNNIIARMDTDDICLPNRFEIQMAYLQTHPDVSVVGGQIEEFIGDEKNIICKRTVPTSDPEIKKFMQKRNPLNHMTVMLKKKDVLEAGNYQEIHYVEDYYLWCRMALNGCRFANLPETVVHARVGIQTYQRRGGAKYFDSWKKLEKFKYEMHLSSLLGYASNLSGRFIVHIIMPHRLRGWIYRNLTREEA